MTMTNKLGEILPIDEALSTEKCKDWWTNKVANGYFTNKVWAFSQPQLINKFDLKNKPILEIGGGYGRETSQFAKLSDKVYVIDISQPSIDLIKENVPSAIGKAYNGTNIPYADDKFDFVYSCFVIQHMSKVDAKKLMKDITRVLSPSGYALIEFYGGAFEAGDGFDHYSGEKKGGMFNNGYTEKEIYNTFDDIDIFIEWIHTRLVPEGKITYSNHFVCFKG